MVYKGERRTPSDSWETGCRSIGWSGISGGRPSTSKSSVTADLTHSGDGIRTAAAQTVFVRTPASAARSRESDSPERPHGVETVRPFSPSSVASPGLPLPTDHETASRGLVPRGKAHTGFEPVPPP